MLSPKTGNAQRGSKSMTVSSRVLRDALSRYKVRTGLAWREIADNAGVAQTTLTRFVNGEGSQGPNLDTVNKILDAHPDLAREVDGAVPTKAIPLFGYLSWQPKYIVSPIMPGQDRYCNVGIGTIHGPTARGIRTGATNRAGFTNWVLFFDEQRQADLGQFPDWKYTGTSYLALVTTDAHAFCGHIRNMGGTIEIYGLSSVGIQWFLSEEIPEEHRPMTLPLDDVRAIYPIYGMLAPNFGATNLPLLEPEVIPDIDINSDPIKDMTVYGGG